MIQKFSKLALGAILLLGSCSPVEFWDSGLGSESESMRMIIPGTGTAHVETWLLGRADSRLIAGMRGTILYMGSLGADNIWLHYGINGWKEIQTVRMVGANLHSGGAEVEIQLPNHARSLEFVLGHPQQYAGRSLAGSAIRDSVLF